MFGFQLGRMGGAGHRGGGAPLWTPAQNFTSGQPGLWYDPSDYSSLSQDSAGTAPVTAVAQPVGRMLDKSGRGNVITQATAASRPLTGTQGAIQYATFDGLDDGLSTGAITLTADMDCFIAVRRNSAAKGVSIFSPLDIPTGWAGVFEAGNSASSFNASVGTPVTTVNGVGVLASRDALHLALTVGAWHVLEMRNLNLLSWANFGVGNYTAFPLNGDIAGVILCPAGDASTRQKNRQYLGYKVGLTLP